MRGGVRLPGRRWRPRRKTRLDQKSRREVVHIKTSETMTQKLVVVVACVALLWPARGSTQARTPASLAVTAQNVTAEAASRTNKSVAQPGDEIRYRLVFTNVTADPVKNIPFMGPIPQGMVYLLGSPASDQPGAVQ